MRCNFRRSLPLILRYAGGHMERLTNPAGASNLGITRRMLAEWRGVAPWWRLPTSELRCLSRREAAKIYRAKYWSAVQGDRLPAGVDYAVFDYAVTSGVRRAVKDLQRITGAKADGIVGPMTLAAVRRHHPKTIIRRLAKKRMNFLRRLCSWRLCGRGWANRMSDVLQQALEMERET